MLEQGKLYKLINQNDFATQDDTTTSVFEAFA